MRSDLVLTLGLLSSASALCVLACQEDTSLSKPLYCPDPELFAEAVSPYLEKRCGTLDCHGSQQRPLRFYGQLGLRHITELNVSGGEPTTEAELADNYLSTCGLEPEKMQEAVTDLGASADQLKLIAKPRGQMDHKGGQVVVEGDPGDRCISGWVGQISEEDAARVRTECKAALDRIK